MSFTESSTKAGSGCLSLKALRKQADFCSKLHERRMTFVQSSTKAGWLPLKVLRKQDGFRWRLYESRMACVESSTEARWLSLKAQRKQDDFQWKLYKSRITFVESSTKARWLSLKTLRKHDDFLTPQKPFKKCVKRNNTKICDKIIYGGCPSFWGRPQPFGELLSHGRLDPPQSLSSKAGLA